MIARVRCETCKETGRFDVGPDVATIEQAQAKVDAAGIETCPFGHHVELSPIGYTVLEVEEGQALTLHEWKVKIAERGYDLWTTEELRETEIEIEAFALGFPMAKVRGRDFHLDFTTAPDGDRYYFAPKGAYAEAVGETKRQDVTA